MTADLAAQIGGIISRAVSDLCDAAASFAAEQAALAVTPQPATGEPMYCTGCLTPMKPGQNCTCAWSNAMRLLNNADKPADPETVNTHLRTRCTQLEQIARDMLRYLRDDGDVSLDDLTRWHTTLHGPTPGS